MVCLADLSLWADAVSCHARHVPETRRGNPLGEIKDLPSLEVNLHSSTIVQQLRDHIQVATANREFQRCL